MDHTTPLDRRPAAAFGPRRPARRLVALVLALGALVLTAGPALAGPILDRAAQGLRRDAVYVDPDAHDLISDGDEDALRRRIRDGEQPIYVAILPAAATDEVGGDAGQLPSTLGRSVGLRGTYAVLAGNSFRVESNSLPRGQAAEIATDVINQSRSQGPGAVLLEFVQRIQAVPRGSSGSSDPFGENGQAAPADGRNDGGGGTNLAPILLLAAAGGGGYLLWRRSKKAQERQKAVAGFQRDLRADVQMLADDVMALEPEVTLHPEARTDYEAGVSRYRWATNAIDAIDEADDVPRIQRALAEGQYAMDRARAIVQGREPPEPPPDLRVQGPRGEPAVELDDERRPAYAGYGGGWYGGGFFGGNDLFTGLLLGQMLGGGFGGWGGGWGGGGGYERGYEEGVEDAGQSDGGGWDGGWGGGDFGGGDFGGGDVGGGDF